MIFAIFSLSTKVIINPICNKISKLFAKDVSIKMTSFKELKSSYTKYKLWVRLSIYYYMHLLSIIVSFFSGLTI